MPDYVIVDNAYGGYAMNDVIEGWIFTSLPEQAAKFSSEVAAHAVVGAHFGNRPSDVSVISTDNLKEFNGG